ncbi:MAG: GDSL-type esterase/lipase family protein [Lachnospiraceae bacterium]|nr:GDSL-type esterase/lipase family protein [Lachnospiraceae bacterium]
MKEIIFLGDSITDCGRLWDVRPEPLGSGYVRILRKFLAKEDCHLTNRGHNGYTAWQVLRDLEEDCLARSPDVVSLLVGINDVSAFLCASGGYDAAEYGALLSEILARIKKTTGAALMVLEPFLFPWPQEYLTWMDTLADFQRAAQQAAAEAGAIWIPLQGFWQQAIEHEGAAALTEDGVHLTPRGHELLAAEWLRCFNNVQIPNESL